jgi:hypothetical protein
MAFYDGIDITSVTTALAFGTRYVASGSKTYRNGFDLDKGCYDSDEGFDSPDLDYDGRFQNIQLGSRYTVPEGVKTFRDGFELAQIALLMGSRYVASGQKTMRSGFALPCMGYFIKIAQPFVDQDDQDLIPIF